MATLKNKIKLVTVARKIQEEYPRNGQSRDTFVLRINVDYIAHVSEIEGRVNKKLSHEFNRTESSTLGVLSKLDECLLYPDLGTQVVYKKA